MVNHLTACQVLCCIDIELHCIVLYIQVNVTLVCHSCALFSGVAQQCHMCCTPVHVALVYTHTAVPHLCDMALMCHTSFMKRMCNRCASTGVAHQFHETDVQQMWHRCGTGVFLRQKSPKVHHLGHCICLLSAIYTWVMYSPLAHLWHTCLCTPVALLWHSCDTPVWAQLLHRFYFLVLHRCVGSCGTPV